jgi:hypothetical protein
LMIDPARRAARIAILSIGWEIMRAGWAKRRRFYPPRVTALERSRG